MGQQRAELKRTAPGKRFIGDTGAEEARQAERAKVTQMQAVARAAALRVEEEEALRNGSRLRAAVRLVRDTTRLAGTVAGLPLRLATSAATLPLRFVSAVLLRPREA